MWAAAVGDPTMQPPPAPASDRWSLTSRHSGQHAIAIGSQDKIYTIKPAAAAAVQETIYTLRPPTAPAHTQTAWASDTFAPPQLPPGILAPALPLLHANGTFGPAPPPPRFAVSPRAHSLFDHSSADGSAAATAAALPSLPSLSSAVAQAAPAHAHLQHAHVHGHSVGRPASPTHFSYAGAVLSRFPPRTQAAAQSFGASPRLQEPRAYTPAAARGGHLPPGLSQPSFTAHTRATSHPHPRDRPSYDPRRATQQHQHHQQGRERRQRSAHGPPAGRLGTLSYRSVHSLPQRRPRGRGAPHPGSGLAAADALVFDDDPAAAAAAATSPLNVDVDALEQWAFAQGSARAQSASANRLPPQQSQRQQRRHPPEQKQDGSWPSSLPPLHADSASVAGSGTVTVTPASATPSSALTATPQGSVAAEEADEESPLQRWRRLQAANRAAQTEAARRAAESRQQSEGGVTT